MCVWKFRSCYFRASRFWPYHIAVYATECILNCLLPIWVLVIIGTGIDFFLIVAGEASRWPLMPLRRVVEWTYQGTLACWLAVWLFLQSLPVVTVLLVVSDVVGDGDWAVSSSFWCRWGLCLWGPLMQLGMLVEQPCHRRLVFCQAAGTGMSWGGAQEVPPTQGQVNAALQPGKPPFHFPSSHWMWGLCLLGGTLT